MKVVILAAGRGSRLGLHSENIPKCLVTLANKPLLLWQIESLHKSGLSDIAVVGGYQYSKIDEFKQINSLNFELLVNNRWNQTNMLSSFICASQWIGNEDVIISYSDIVYSSNHLNLLMKSKGEIAITYDTEWDKLWRFRNPDNPLNDAETFKTKDGQLIEIGLKPENWSQVQGQYMGLIKLTREGLKTWLQHCSTLGETVDRTDMTTFLRRLLNENIPITTVPVKGAWCEVDTDNDLRLYEEALNKNDFSHDWRN
jgi:choline kinase